MDTGYDFISPEFFNILFFSQKNLVIYPYVDVKHIHSLDCFTVGYDVIDIDSTGIENICDIVEYETNNSYSQQPTLYYLLNVSSDDLEKLLESPNIRCIINTSENVEHLAQGTQFIFYNKKNKSFLNYQPEKADLSFEQHLIRLSQNEKVLLDEILKIKSTASKIYSDVNTRANSGNLPMLLHEYDQEYWDKILLFTSKYFNVEIPKFRKPKLAPKKNNSALSKDFSHEYEFIIKTNRNIGKNFIQLLHDYRYDKVNPANLEIDQLYYPKKLYNYLRNRHWIKGIPQDFIINWIQTLSKNSNMNEDDKKDFQIIFDKLQVKPVQKFNVLQENSLPIELNKEKMKVNYVVKKKEVEVIPSIENFEEFKNWLLKQLDILKNLI